MKRFILMTAMLIGLAGCSGNTIDAAHKAVQNQLKDPYSAVFSRDTIITFKEKSGSDSVVVCGFVNAKNGFGAYSGDSLYFTVSNVKTPTLIWDASLQDFDTYAAYRAAVEREFKNGTGSSMTVGFNQCVDKLRLTTGPFA